MRIGGEGATNGATIGYDRGFCFPLCLVNPFVMKPLRQQNRPVISYVPRVEPAPPEHAVKNGPFSRCLDFAREVCRFSADGGAFPSLTGIQRAGVGAALG